MPLYSGADSPVAPMCVKNHGMFSPTAFESGSRLTFFDRHIQRVVMRLSDINRLHGGADNRYHLQVVLTDMPDVVIEDTGLTCTTPSTARPIAPNVALNVG